MLVSAGDDGDLVILDPELARRVLSKLGLSECKHGARVGDLRVLHLYSDWSVRNSLASDWSVRNIQASDWSVRNVLASDWSVRNILASDWLLVEDYTGL